MTAPPTPGARPVGRVAVLAIALLALLAAVVVPGRADAAQAPRGFFGVYPLNPVPGDYAAMADGDVGMIRTGFPYRQWKADHHRFDSIVRSAAEQGIDLLPVVVGTDSSARGATPLDSAVAKANWRDYLTALVERYGPKGDFWSTDGAGVPKMPITDWQVWNEPNSFVNWNEPSPRQYGELLARSAATIHAADPAARVVSAGVVAQPLDDITEPGADYLRRMFRSPAAAAAADVIALHPYTKGPGSMTKLIRQTRKTMTRAGLGRTPIWITEVGWGAGAPKPKTTRGLTPEVPGRWSQTKAKQRSKLRRALATAVEQRRKLGIGRIVWYQWQDGPDPACAWCVSAGLIRQDGTPKPLLSDFSRIANSRRAPLQSPGAGPRSRR